MGYITHTCSIRKFIIGKGKEKYVWVLKDQAYLIRTNLNRPKLKWVPKSSSSSFVDISQGRGQSRLG